MEQVSPVYNYTIEQEGEYSKITYQKKHVSNVALFPLALYAALPVIMLVSAMQPDTIKTAFFLWLFIDVGIAFLILYLLNSKRKPGEIRISKTNLVVDDKHYELSHISLFSLRDRKGAEYGDTIYISHVASPANSARQLFVLTGNAFRNQLNASGYRIIIRYASKEIIIANHLGELEADDLFRKITQITGYTTPA